MRVSKLIYLFNIYLMSTVIITGNSISVSIDTRFI